MSGPPPEDPTTRATARPPASGRHAPATSDAAAATAVPAPGIRYVREVVAGQGLGPSHIMAFDTIQPLKWRLVTVAENSAVVGNR